ncbi:MAG: class I SAM-dependent methyltransferase [Phycisphaerae bacterium]|nr:class I SAM-dependent methyltransferase [Phycisphaerae bacterium]
MLVFRDKFDWIGRFVESDSSVLDLGCVCHDLDQTAVPWLHAFLVKRAGRVVGVDILPDAVDRMNREGFTAVCANAETVDLGETFDVVVAGDILEHLGNLGEFLDRAKRHLADEGVLLITTPNPITYVRFLRVLLKGQAGANKEHTCWFTAKVLRQLARRHGLVVAEEAYLNDTRLFYPWTKPVKAGSPTRRLFRHVNRMAGMLLIWKPAVLAQSLLCRIRPRLGETLCLALRKE